MQILNELSELDYKWITLRKGNEILYPLTLTIYEAIKNGKPLTSICDLCIYNPPSSTDGKPCTMCPADKERDND